MATQSEIKSRVKNLFTRPDDTENAATIQSRTITPPATQRHFSAFNPDDQDRAAELLFRVMEEFGNQDSTDNGIEAAVDVLEDVSQRGDWLLAQHVMGIFAAHAPKVRDGTMSIPIPPLVFAEDSQRRSARRDGDISQMPDTPTARAIAPSGEDQMHWFREDIHVNEHHRHWHMVYATSGIPSGPPGAPRFPVRMKRRQGEVFVYMHKQMLARYDSERIAAGLEPTQAFTVFSESLGAGYDPDAREPIALGYASRDDDAEMDAAAQLDLDNRRESFRIFLQTGRIAGVDIDINATTVGTALESNRALVSNEFNNMDEYREAGDIVRSLHLHNVGHGVIASLGESGAGVMTNPHTSLQDPIFWRWHKMIDDLAEDYYASLPPHEIDSNGIELISASTIDSPLLVFSETTSDSIPFANSDRQQFRDALQTVAQQTFASGTGGADRLRTGLFGESFRYRGQFHGQSVADQVFLRDSLFCERFAFGVRVQAEREMNATVRIFICDNHFLDLDTSPTTAARQAIRSQEHRYWIELERQPVELATGENIFTFPADESSIVRKIRGQAKWPTSAVTEADFDDLHADAPGDRDDYCDCGWPFNLLLPRGDINGRAFHLMLMVSEGAPAVGPGACGSRSFCGTDFDGYPELDEINLGYPFDRPAPGGTIAFINQRSDMHLLPITIRHEPGLWSDIHPVPA